MKYLKAIISGCFLFLMSCKKEKLNLPDQIKDEATSAFKSSQTGYQFTPLDVPLSWGSGTSAYGINNDGEVVGNYVTTTGGTGGFIYSNGEFTDVIIPGADPANRGGLTNINDNGTAIGGFNYPDDKIGHSFKRIETGSFTILPDVPKAVATEARGINKAETIVGTYIDRSSNRHGFIFKDGVITTYDKPGAFRTLLSGINNNDVIVGYYRNSKKDIARGFTLYNGVISDIVFPGAVRTAPYGINNHGQVVGEYIDASGVTHGFIFKNGSFNTVDYPGAFDTAILGINDDGQIVGTYNGYSFGFIATPVE